MTIRHDITFRRNPKSGAYVGQFQRAARLVRHKFFSANRRIDEAELPMEQTHAAGRLVKDPTQRDVALLEQLGGVVLLPQLNAQALHFVVRRVCEMSLATRFELLA
ncbi:MAG: hypothetical protein J5J06_16065 [Phycisphaerae bacterium]|nr:hypothetical protein [Phycisphaerae bacterium]